MGTDEGGDRTLPPYFLQDITIDEIVINGKNLYSVSIDIKPLEIILYCEKIEVKSS